MILVQVASCNHLAILLLQECLGIDGSHHAPTDQAQGDAIGSRDPAGAGPGGTGNEHRGSGAFQKTAPGWQKKWIGWKVAHGSLLLPSSSSWLSSLIQIFRKLIGSLWSPCA